MRKGADNAATGVFLKSIDREVVRGVYERLSDAGLWALDRWVVISAPIMAPFSWSRHQCFGRLLPRRSAHDAVDLQFQYFCTKEVALVPIMKRDNVSISLFFRGISSSCGPATTRSRRRKVPVVGDVVVRASRAPTGAFRHNVECFMASGLS